MLKMLLRYIYACYSMCRYSTGRQKQNNKNMDILRRSGFELASSSTCRYSIGRQKQNKKNMDILRRSGFEVASSSTCRYSIGRQKQNKKNMDILRRSGFEVASSSTSFSSHSTNTMRRSFKPGRIFRYNRSNTTKVLPVHNRIGTLIAELSHSSKQSSSATESPSSKGTALEKAKSRIYSSGDIEDEVNQEVKEKVAVSILNRLSHPYVNAYICAIQNAYERTMSVAMQMVYDSDTPWDQSNVANNKQNIRVLRCSCLFISWKFAIALSPHFRHEDALSISNNSHSRDYTGWLRSLFVSGVELPEGWATWLCKLMIKTWEIHGYRDICSKSSLNRSVIDDKAYSSMKAPPLSKSEAHAVLTSVRKVITTDEWMSSVEQHVQRSGISEDSQRVSFQMEFPNVKGPCYENDPSPHQFFDSESILDDSQTISVHAIRRVCIARDLSYQVSSNIKNMKRIKERNDQTEGMKAALECRMLCMTGIRFQFVEGLLRNNNTLRLKMSMQLISHPTSILQWMAMRRNIQGLKNVMNDDDMRHDIVLQILYGVMALHTAHPRPICHRDIRPSNIDVYQDVTGHPIAVITGMKLSRYVTAAWNSFEVREQSRVISRGKNSSKRRSLPFESEPESPGSSREPSPSHKSFSSFAQRGGNGSGKLVLDHRNMMMHNRDAPQDDSSSCSKEVKDIFEEYYEQYPHDHDDNPSSPYTKKPDERSITMYVGSLSYLPPETLCGIQSSALSADLWSLGCTMLDILRDGKQLLTDGLEMESVRNRVVRLCYKCEQDSDGFYHVVEPKSVNSIRREIKSRCSVDVHDPTMDVEIVSNLMRPVPEDRWTAEQAIKYIMEYKRYRYVTDEVNSRIFTSY